MNKLSGCREPGRQAFSRFKGNLGTMYGVTALGYSAAGLVGPSAAAMIRDTTGSYGIMFYALGVCALIGIIFSEYLNRWADPAKQK